MAKSKTAVAALIELPADVRPGASVVHRNITSIPDVWRHYDLERAERREPSAAAVVCEGELPDVRR